MKNHNILQLSLLLVIVSLTSCSIFRPGVKSLDNFDVSKISLRTENVLKLPGTRFKSGFVVFTQDNQIFKTSGFLRGSLSWKNFDITLRNAKFSNGKITIDQTETNDFKYIPLQFSPKHQPEKIFRDTVWLNYENNLLMYPLNTFKKIPGTKVKLGIRVTYDNGQQLTYEGNSSIKKILKDYEVFPKGGTFLDGDFVVSDNIFDNQDHTPGLMIQLKKDTNVYSIFDFRFDYKEAYQYNASGRSGMFGSSGFSGSSGATGEHGRHGEDGENGRHGDHANDIDVYADVYYDTILQTKLIKLLVDDISRNMQRYYYINPDGGNISIFASGGNGGSGGSGGNGGKGGTGYTGEFYTDYVKEVIVKKDTAGKEIRQEILKPVTRQRKGGDGGFGGDGGYGGIGGDGGNGGYVIVYFTAGMKNYMNLIKVQVNGGIGGSGGWGGTGGSGGSGGAGNPPGRNGRSGMNGMNGPGGHNGSSGRVEFRQVEAIPW